MLVSIAKREQSRTLSSAKIQNFLQTKSLFIRKTSFLYLSYRLMAFLFVFLRQLRMHHGTASFDGGDNVEAGIAADFTHSTNGAT